MRFLFVDSNYSDFLDSIYSDVADLGAAPYETQIARIRDGLFGEAQFQAAALRLLGHDADVVIVNAHAAQRAWAHEHGLRPKASNDGWALGRRGGVVPWLVRRQPQPDWEVVLAQARAFRPDVLYVEIMDTLPAPVARELRGLARLAIAQVATDIPASAYRDYDLVISSIPDLVDDFARRGIDSEWMPLAFEPRIISTASQAARDIPVSFVGAFTSVHRDREDIVGAVALVADLSTWTADGASLRADSVIRPTIRGTAFGRQMYEILARSRITLNSHREVAGADANNLRLYEATGMGALLITDARRNLSHLFEVGSEVLAYETPADAAELTRYYVDHPQEGAQIAAAGQARTLRDHTWLDRMARVVAAVERRM